MNDGNDNNQQSHKHHIDDENTIKNKAGSITVSAPGSTDAQLSVLETEQEKSPGSVTFPDKSPESTAEGDSHESEIYQRLISITKPSLNHQATPHVNNNYPLNKLSLIHI